MTHDGRRMKTGHKSSPWAFGSDELKRESIQLYFSEVWGGGGGKGLKYKDFWPTIHPFLETKGCISGETITIAGNDKVINRYIRNIQ